MRLRPNKRASTDQAPGPKVASDKPKAAKTITGPACVDGIGPAGDWQGYWQRTDAVRQSTKSWTNGH